MELVLGKVLTVGSLDTTLLTRLLIDVGMKVVVMHVLRSSFTRARVEVGVVATVGHVVPAGLGLVREHGVGTVVPLEPSPHLVRQVPDGLFIGTLVQPMVVRALPLVSPGVKVAGELALKSRNDVVELESVGREVHPSRVSGENAESITRPHTVAGAPHGNIRLSLSHVGSEVVNVTFPVRFSALGLKVLSEDGSPLAARNVVVDVLVSLRHVQLADGHTSGRVDVRLELLVRFVVGVIEGTAVKINNTSAPVQIGISSGKGNLGTESVTTKGSHSELLLIHETDNIVGDLIHGEALVMIGVAHVAVVNEPDVADVKDLVVGSVEERSEVFSRLNEVSEPDHGRHVRLSAGKMNTSQLDVLSFVLLEGL